VFRGVFSVYALPGCSLVARLILQTPQLGFRDNRSIQPDG